MPSCTLSHFTFWHELIGFAPNWTLYSKCVDINMMRKSLPFIKEKVFTYSGLGYVKVIVEFAKKQAAYLESDSGTKTVSEHFFLDFYNEI